MAVVEYLMSPGELAQWDAAQDEADAPPWPEPDDRDWVGVEE